VSNQKLRQLQDDLWVIDHPFQVGGLHLGTRTTLIKTADGIWVHSPGPLVGGIKEEIESLGPVAHIVAPNTMHYLYFEENKLAFPAATGWAGRGLRKKAPGLPADRHLEEGEHWGGPDLIALNVGGIPMLQETVFYHATSRTLVVTDLVFNLRHSDHWPTRVAMKLNGAYGKLTPSRLFRHVIASDKRALGNSIARIQQWDIERIIMGHGDILPQGGSQALRKAFDWLSPARS
jgi:hypothetical protein